MTISYRGKTFPGYNRPIDSDRPNKKKMVLAKKGDKVKLIHFGQKGYKHNYSAAAKKNYLSRSAGIRGKGGKLTKDDKFSANYWARRVLWPKGPTKEAMKKESDAGLAGLQAALGASFSRRGGHHFGGIGGALGADKGRRTRAGIGGLAGSAAGEALAKELVKRFGAKGAMGLSATALGRIIGSGVGAAGLHGVSKTAMRKEASLPKYVRETLKAKGLSGFKNPETRKWVADRLSKDTTRHFRAGLRDPANSPEYKAKIRKLMMNQLDITHPKKKPGTALMIRPKVDTSSFDEALRSGQVRRERRDRWKKRLNAVKNYGIGLGALSIPAGIVVLDNMEAKRTARRSKTASFKRFGLTAGGILGGLAGLSALESRGRLWKAKTPILNSRSSKETSINRAVRKHDKGKNPLGGAAYALTHPAVVGLMGAKAVHKLRQRARAKDLLREYPGLPKFMLKGLEGKPVTLPIPGAWSLESSKNAPRMVGFTMRKVPAPLAAAIAGLGIAGLKYLNDRAVDDAILQKADRGGAKNLPKGGYWRRIVGAVEKERG